MNSEHPEASASFRKLKVDSRAVLRTGVPEYFIRFTVRQRIEHLVVALTFIILLLTGLPQKYYDSAWAEETISLLGGIDVVRMIHRGAGVVFTLSLLFHMAFAIGRFLLVKREMPMVPNGQDFRDAVMNIKYYLGTSEERPEFGRYDYRQKFEYWGLVFGGMLMIVSGFILYHPGFFGRVLPGQFIPAAKVAHSYEAMMALLTIIVWHMYGAHLNPECFPIDTSIFTGKITRERMMKHHGREFERITGKKAGEEK